MITQASPFSRRALFGAAAAPLIAGLHHPGRAAAQEIPILNYPTPLRDPSEYTAYVPCASKTGPFYHYTCEFDSSWAIFKTFGIDALLDEQLGLIPIDTRIEPYY
jgi:hypothetical protein